MNLDDLKLLGLKDGADLKAVENSYEIITRRHMEEIKEGSTTIENEMQIKEINAAYSRLIGKKDSVQNRCTPEKGKWFVGYNRESFGNFFYLFKLQFVGALIGAVILSLFIYSMVTRTEYQFQVAYWGQVTTDQKGLDELIKKSSGLIKNVQYFESAGKGFGPEVFLAVYSTAMLDSIVVDKNNYKSFATDGFFLSLDDLAKEAGLDIKKQQDLIVTSSRSKDKVPHLYGLNVSNIKVLNKTIYSGGAIITIPANTSDMEGAKKFMRIIMKIAAQNK